LLCPDYGATPSNLTYLKWRDIKWEPRHIEVRTKSNKPGGEIQLLPLTQYILEILAAEHGNHPEYVFTMIAKKLHESGNW
jgi:integrase